MWRAWPGLVYSARVCERPTLLVAVVALLVGCAPAGTQLVVQVVTDLAPVVDFDEIHVEAPAGATPVVIAAHAGAGYGRAVRVLSVDTTASVVPVRVALFLQGVEVVSASRTRRLSGPTTILTVRLSRDCIGVVCGDALAGACLGGVCVSDECTPETPERCPIGECGPTAGGTTCAPSGLACVETVCAAEGICVDDPRDERCGAAQVCQAVGGCVAAIGPDAGSSGDAGPSDAGADATADAGADAAAAPRPTPVARVLSTAYWTNWFGPVYETPGMSVTGYEIPTAGVVDGELLVFVACVDNGTSTVWPNPLGPGFTQLTQDGWGHDGQTCAIDWKVAAGEPASYTGTYGPGIVSASAVLTLIAISGADPIAPVGPSLVTVGTGADLNPVESSSLGVTTTVPNALLLYTASGDWNCFNVSTVTFTVPSGYTTLLQLGDHGTEEKDWTAIQVERSEQALPGPTGTVSSTMMSTTTCAATPWNALLAIYP